MMINQFFLKIFLSVIFIAFSSKSFGQTQVVSKSDIWSGEYEVYSRDNLSTPIDTLVILKTKDADAEKLVSKLKADIARWNISSKSNPKDESLEVRRFLTDDLNAKNEYKEFGWEELNKKGKMNCIDGGHFFICKSEPEILIQFNKEESYFSKTGIFGIWLHQGLVDLKKIK